MEILSYNRRLAWVVVPLALWALFGSALAIGAGRRPDDKGPFHVRVGLPEGGLWLPGHLISVTETAEMLTIRIGVRPGENPRIDHSHDDLSIEVVEFPGKPEGEPQIQVLSSEVHLTRGGRGAALAEKYVIKFDRWHLQLVPRGPELTDEQFRRGIEQYFRDGERRRPMGQRGRGPGGADNREPPPPPEGGRPERGAGPTPPRRR